MTDSTVSTSPGTGRTPRPRIQALDVIRGVAILGTFGTNVWIFAEPGGGAGYLLAMTAPEGVLETVLRGVTNGKFLALLTLLFGIGLELQHRSAVRRGLRWPGRYLRRAGILTLEGFLHYVLVFEFDVLMGYGIASIVVAYLIGRSAAVHRRWMIGIGVPYVLVMVAGTVAGVAAGGSGGTGPVDLPGTGSWPSQVLLRLIAFPLYRIELVAIVPSAIVLFLVGARLLRNGVFEDTGAGLRRRLMAFGFGIGVPLHVATTWAGPDWFLIERYLLGPLIAFGLLALVTEVVLRSRRPGVGQRTLGLVGRTALTCYVLQNLLASIVCYDWGLGLGSRLESAPSWWPIGLWLVVGLVNLAFAAVWLRFFDRGPLELVAHRLAGGHRQVAAAQ